MGASLLQRQGDRNQLFIMKNKFSNLEIQLHDTFIVLCL